MAGEYYHLDPEKDKDEVKKILSPSYQFKEYIHVNAETLPKELLEVVGEETVNSFHGYDDPEEREYVSTLIDGTQSTEQIEDPGPDYQEPQTLDAQENKWEKGINDQKFKKEDKENQDSEVSTPDLAPVEEVEDAAPAKESFKDGEIEERRKELDEMHYTKIQDVAEQYDIEYTKKDDTIEKILKAEFGVATETKDVETELKEDEPLKE